MNKDAVYIIAVDPGITSGIAALKFAPGEISCERLLQVRDGLKGLVDAVDAISGGLPKYPVALVIEDFILPYRVHGPQEAKTTLLYIGALTYWAAREIVDVALIMPAETKAFGMKRVCEVTGMFPVRMRRMTHASDAVRVGLAYWSKRYREEHRK